jgi:hypothetical protein
MNVRPHRRPEYYSSNLAVGTITAANRIVGIE